MYKNRLHIYILATIRKEILKMLKYKILKYKSNKT